MVSLPISGVVQRESGTFFVPCPNQLTLLFHLKYYKMKDKHNLPAHLAISEALSRELPIDPELRDIILLAEETMRRFDHYHVLNNEENTAENIYKMIKRTEENLTCVLEDLSSILSEFMIASLSVRLL